MQLTQQPHLQVVTVGMAVAISFFLSLVERRVVRFKYSTRVLKMLYREVCGGDSS